MREAGSPGTRAGFVSALSERANKRSESVKQLATELFAYQKARAVLDGPALAEWTASYEQSLQRLVALAVEGINDVFDSGSWEHVIETISKSPASESAGDLMKRVQALAATDLGPEIAASIDVLAKFLGNTKIESGGTSPGGTGFTLSGGDAQRVAFRLSAKRGTGDAARKSSASVLGGRSRLVVERSILPVSAAGASTELGTLDFYGSFLAVCSWLLANARREVRTTQRYGRPVVQGQAPILIALAIWAAIVAVLWTNYALWCTGAIISSNAPNQQSSACQTFEGIATVVSVIGIFIVIGLGTASNNFSSSAVNGVTFNLN